MLNIYVSTNPALYYYYYFGGKQVIILLVVYWVSQKWQVNFSLTKSILLVINNTGYGKMSAICSLSTWRHPINNRGRCKLIHNW
jgi:hypothetical protein